MAEKYLFFDSTPEDQREYPASDFAEFYSLILTSGIYNGGNNLIVSCTGTDINSRVQPGYAWIKGYMYGTIDDPVVLVHDLPDPANDRIDRVVVRLDKSFANRYVKAFILNGTPAADPVPPELTRNDNIYEISLAQVRIIAGKSYIEVDQITDERLDETVCGLINSLIQVDTAHMQAQFDAFIASLNSEGFVSSTTFNAHVAENATTSKAGHVKLSTSITSTSTSTAATSSAVKAAMDQANAAFTSASDGKLAIATAITGKGVPASSGDTFASLASKIGQIVTGRKWAEGTGRIPNTSSTYTVTNSLEFQPDIVVVTGRRDYDEEEFIMLYGSNSDYGDNYYIKGGNPSTTYPNKLLILSNGFAILEPYTVRSADIEWMAFSAEGV